MRVLLRHSSCEHAMYLLKKNTFKCLCLSHVPALCVHPQLSKPDLSHVYLAYTAESAEEAMRPSKPGAPHSSKAKHRPKTSKKWVH